MTERAAAPTRAGARGLQLRACVKGAWLNRRYTRLSSSIILSGMVWAATMTALLFVTLDTASRLGPTRPWAEIATTGLFYTLSAVFYPATREGYYRVTRPLRAGIGGFFVGGVFGVIILALRGVIFCALWVFAIPLGLVASIALAAADVRGRGRRTA